MIIATFGAGTGWVGKTITYENDAFVLEGFGSIRAADLMEYDRQGHLVWVNDGTRAWVGAKAKKEGLVSRIVPATTSSLVANSVEVRTEENACPVLTTSPTQDARPSAPVDDGGAENPVTAAAALPWWRQKYIVPAAAGIVLMVLVIVAAALTVKAQSDRKEAGRVAATKVVQPFRKLDSALGVGINFAEYGKLVRDAQFALDSYHPTDTIGQDVARNLDKAAEAYRTAAEAWNDDIQDEFVADASIWNTMCPALALPAGTVTAEDVRQAAWAVGTVNVTQASTLVGL